jgi:hypothetical protein
MKRHLSLTILLILYFSSSFGQIISQYIETSAGTTPKGIEIWNNTALELNFASNNLVIEKGTNGAIPSLDFTINSGTLQPGKVVVIGTSDLQTTTVSNGSLFYLKSFTFNGDDALVIKYGGVITDVLGQPGSDPGTAWEGNGISTANQNIALKTGITTGDTDGWTDPSSRFETVATDNSQTGFGLAPLPPTPSITVNLTSLSGFKYLIEKGPSSSKSFVVSGIWLSDNIVITPPDDYEISSNNITFQNTAINLTQSGGTILNTTIYVRLKSGLNEGIYNGDIDVTSTGVIDKKIICSGIVSPIPNAWINEFHYDNNGADVNEFIEVVIENASNFNLADFTLSLYNGGDGSVYNSQTINNFIVGQSLNGYSLFTWSPSSIQNGPDGFSLDYLNSTLLFISYEGVFYATNGPSNGLKSISTNVFEGSFTLSGHSLQLCGTGSIYPHFCWSAQPETPGEINPHQMFGEYIPPVPVNYWIILLVFLLILTRIFINKTTILREKY